MYTRSTSSVTNVSANAQTFAAREDSEFSLSNTTRPSSNLATALADMQLIGGGNDALALFTAACVVMNSADWIRWIIPYGDDG
jgi:hypothetical protein